MNEECARTLVNSQGLCSPKEPILDNDARRSRCSTSIAQGEQIRWVEERICYLLSRLAISLSTHAWQR